MKNPFSKFLSEDKINEMLSETNVRGIITDVREDLRKFADEIGKEVSQIKQSEKLKIVKNRVRQKTGMNSITAKIAMTAIDMYIKDKKSKYGDEFKIHKNDFVKFITTYVQIGKETAAELFELVKATFSDDFSFVEQDSDTKTDVRNESSVDQEILEQLKVVCIEGDVDIFKGFHRYNLSSDVLLVCIEEAYQNGNYDLVAYLYDVINDMCEWQDYDESKYTNSFYKYCVLGDTKSLLSYDYNADPVNYKEIFYKFFKGYQFTLTPGHFYSSHTHTTDDIVKVVSVDLDGDIVEARTLESENIVFCYSERVLSLGRVPATPYNITKLFGNDNKLPIEFLGEDGSLKCVVLGDYVTQYIDEVQTILDLNEIPYV